MYLWLQKHCCFKAIQEGGEDYRVKDAEFGRQLDLLVVPKDAIEGSKD